MWFLVLGGALASCGGQLEADGAPPPAIAVPTPPAADARVSRAPAVGTEREERPNLAPTPPRPSPSQPCFDGLTFLPLAPALECSGHTATLLGDGRVLVRGDCALDGKPESAVLVNPMAFELEPVEAKARTAHTATTLADGRVLVVGGKVDGAVDGGIEIFCPHSEVFGELSPLAQQRAEHTATLLPDGRVLIAGGFTGKGVTDSVEIWDASTHSASPGPKLLKARGRHVAVPHAGRIALVGGPTSLGWLDPAVMAWSEEPGFLHADHVRSVAQLDASRWLGLASYERSVVFEFGTNAAFEIPGSAPAPHRAVAPVAGRWLALGGSYYAHPPPPALFDAESASFCPVSTLAADFWDVTLTSLDDGSLLVVGASSGVLMKLSW